MEIENIKQCNEIEDENRNAWGNEDQFIETYVNRVTEQVLKSRKTGNREKTQTGQGPTQRMNAVRHTHFMRENENELTKCGMQENQKAQSCMCRAWCVVRCW